MDGGVVRSYGGVRSGVCSVWSVAVASGLFTRANFLERRKAKVRRTSLPRTPLNGDNSALTVSSTWELLRTDLDAPICVNPAGRGLRRPGEGGERAGIDGLRGGRGRARRQDKRQHAHHKGAAQSNFHASLILSSIAFSGHGFRRRRASGRSRKARTDHTKPISPLCLVGDRSAVAGCTTGSPRPPGAHVGEGVVPSLCPLRWSVANLWL